MTDWADVKDRDNFIKILDHGFVGLIDHMGSDAAIVQAARVSYGAGTKSVSEDRGLIRYLLNHSHMTPFEMAEAKFMLKIPIFVMRQLIRHRTASPNEYSGRYSLMPNEYYLPEIDKIQPQSKDNKQGRAGSFSEDESRDIQHILRTANENAFSVYNGLVGRETPLARELARTILPLSGYTKLYWKQDLRCLFHLINLREDSHAQWEIQEVARAMKKLITPLFPLAVEAFEDYVQNSARLSAPELSLLKDVVLENKSVSDLVTAKLEKSGMSPKDFAKKYNMTVRELNEFRQKLR